MKLNKLLLPALMAASMAPITANADDGIKISTKGGLKIENADGSAHFRLGGRLQWDYDSTSSDLKDEETFEVRRARLAARGAVGDWGYKMQFNLGEDGGGSAEDLYMTYNGYGKKAKITIGKHREPFGLEDQTSSNNISLLERTALSEFYAPGRNAGVQLSGVQNNLTYAVGVYRDDASDDESIAQRAITGRITYAVVNDDDLLVHLGAAYRSGDISSQAGLEAAAVMGPLHVQAEYFEADADESDSVDGYYFQVGYVLTGETRPYKNGVFKKVKSSGGTAIEIVGRYEDGYGKYSDVGLDTKEGNQFSLGLNFYVNSNVRLGFSYMDGETESDAGDLSGDELRFRTQFTF